MAGSDAVEVSFDGGERSGTRFANSSITWPLRGDNQICATGRSS